MRPHGVLTARSCRPERGDSQKGSRQGEGRLKPGGRRGGALCVTRSCRSPPCHRPLTTSAPNILIRLSLVDGFRRNIKGCSIARTPECSSQVLACRRGRGQSRSLRAEGGREGRLCSVCHKQAHLQVRASSQPCCTVVKPKISSKCICKERLLCKLPVGGTARSRHPPNCLMRRRTRLHIPREHAPLAAVWVSVNEKAA